MRLLESAENRVMRKSGRKPTECKCSACKNQCKTPGLATPNQILKLVESGYKDKIVFTEWAVGLYIGLMNKIIPMYQILADEEGCVFQDRETGLCELHNTGLKPLECRLSHHTIKKDNVKFTKSLSYLIAQEWVSDDNFDTILKIASIVDEAKICSLCER